MADKTRPGLDLEFQQLEITDVKETGKELGRGSYGEVREADWRGTRCATKRLHNVFLSVASRQGRNKPLVDFISECHTWSRLRHPNIVQLLGVVFEEGSNLPVLVLEIMPTTLRIHLETRGKREFLMEQKIDVLHQVALGLAYLHGQNQVHRDLSTNNILLHPGHCTAKITDFGVTRAINSDREHQTGSTVVPGTYAFMPPEVFDVPPRYNDRADVFSLGCVILSTLSHAWPQPLAAKVKKDGKLVALSELERRAQYFAGLSQAERTLFQSHIEICLEEEADGRPSSLSIAKDLGELQQCYRGQSLEERVHELEAVVGSLEECIADLRVKNEELMQANTNLNEDRDGLLRTQLDLQERLANSERRIPDLKQVVAKDCSHSSGEHTPTQSDEWETVVGGDEQEEGSETEANEQKPDGNNSSDGSGGVTRKSLSGTLESLRLKKSATSLPRKREELCATSDTEFKSDSEMEGLSHPATTSLERLELEEPSSFSTVQRRDHPTASPVAPGYPRKTQSVLEGTIMFHKRGEPYYEFSTSYPAPITIKGKTYASCENYVLAQKYAGTALEEQIRKCNDAQSAQVLCRQSTASSRYNWEVVRVTAMEQALYAKFTQHEDLRQLLLSTEPRNIVFHIMSDEYWGDGQDGGGQNQLGKMLMQLRSEL